MNLERGYEKGEVILRKNGKDNRSHDNKWNGAGGKVTKRGTARIGKKIENNNNNNNPDTLC